MELAYVEGPVQTKGLKRNQSLRSADAPNARPEPYLSREQILVASASVRPIAAAVQVEESPVLG